MQNRIFKSLISRLLIASPLWWTSGCYTYRETTNVKEARENERKIEVTTKGNNIYVFQEWTLDKSGAITGHAFWKDASHPNKQWYTEGSISLSSDSIKSVSAKELNVAVTVLVIFGSVATAVGIRYLARLSESWSRWHFVFNAK